MQALDLGPARHASPSNESGCTAMPPHATALREGDQVSVQTKVWGEAWARSVHGEKEWKTGITFGTVIRKGDGAKWVCNFAENDGKYATWERKTLTFVKRSAPAPAPTSASAPASASSKATGKAPAAAPPAATAQGGPPLAQLCAPHRAGGWRQGAAARPSLRLLCRRREGVGLLRSMLPARHHTDVRCMRAKHGPQLHAAACKWRPAEAHHAEAQERRRGNSLERWICLAEPLRVRSESG